MNRFVFDLFLICLYGVHSGKSLFSQKLLVANVILFWLKWAVYLAVAGLNLVAQLSDRISPYGV